MRVLNPGPGEVVDRLTIVARKIVEGGSRAEHFHKEMEELLHHLEVMDTPVEMDAKDFGKTLHLLSATNASLWQLEDRVREFRNGKPPGTQDFSQLTFRIQELNDLRNKLVRQLNAAAGVVREEKL